MAVKAEILTDTGAVIMDNSTILATNVASVTVGISNGSYTLPSDVPGRITYVVPPGGQANYQPTFTVSTDKRTVSWTWKNSGSASNSTFLMLVAVH